MALASVLSACRSTGVNRKKAVIGQMGLGAAGLVICHMLMAYGVEEVYGIDCQQEAIDRLDACCSSTTHR